MRIWIQTSAISLRKCYGVSRFAQCHESRPETACVRNADTMCPQKQSQRIVSTILVRTDEISENLENLFPSLVRTELQLHFQQSLCNTLTWDIIMTSCRTERYTISRTEKTGPFDCFCNHQSVALLSLCLFQCSRWIFWPRFVVFGTGTINQYENRAYPIRCHKLIPEKFGTKLHDTCARNRLLATISGKCVMGISLSERQSIKSKSPSITVSETTDLVDIACQ